jgi:hypothetical protein
VAVVAAGVHRVRVGAAVREGVHLLDRQRVHVGAQADHALACAAVTAVHQADHARLCEAAVDLDAPGREPFGHQVGREALLEAELGVRVDAAAQRRDVAGVRFDVGDECHQP